MAAILLSINPRICIRTPQRCLTNLNTVNRVRHLHQLIPAPRKSSKAIRLPLLPPTQTSAPLDHRADKQAPDSQLRTFFGTTIFYPSFLCIWALSEIVVGAPDAFSLFSVTRALVCAKVVKLSYDRTKDVCRTSFLLRNRLTGRDPMFCKVLKDLRAMDWKEWIRLGRD